MHGRQRIIRAAENLVLGKPFQTGVIPVYPVPEIGGRTFRNRPTPIWRPEVPCICFYCLGDEGDSQETEPPSYVRVATLVVEIVVTAEKEADELADRIAEKVEPILIQNRFLRDPMYVYPEGDSASAYLEKPELDPANTCQNFKYLRTEIVFVGEKVENIVTSCRISYEATFRQDQPAISPTDIFDKLHADYRVNGVGPNDDASDLQTHIHQEE